jgi:hypothetical protein
MISWPQLNGKPVGRVLRSSTWDTSPGIIADQTRSGKYKVRANHVFTPDAFKIEMHMTLAEYRVFDSWWRTVCRKGLFTFGYPKINDDTKAVVEYQFVPDSNPSIVNTSAYNLQITMEWMEAT